VELEVVFGDFDEQLLAITRENALDLQRLVLKRDKAPAKTALRDASNLGRILHRITQTNIRALSVDWIGALDDPYGWALDRYSAFSLSPQHHITELCLSLALVGYSPSILDVKEQLEMIKRLGAHESLETLILCDVLDLRLCDVACAAIQHCRQVHTLSVSSRDHAMVDVKHVLAAFSGNKTALANLLFYQPSKPAPVWGWRWDSVQSGRVTFQSIDVNLSPREFRQVVHLMRSRNLVFDYRYGKWHDGLWNGAVVPINVPSVGWEKMSDDVWTGVQLTLNQANSAEVRKRVLWANATVVTAFQRANLNHRYEPSILALMPSIMSCLATTNEWKENRAAQNSAFMGSKFAKNTCLVATAVAPPPVVVAVASGRKRKGVTS